MRINWPARKKGWPDEINGYQTRPRDGACPECGASETSWCSADCTRLDPMDYR